MDIKYRQLTPDDSTLFPQGLELLNRTQGRDLFPLEYLALRTADPDSYVAGALSDDRLIGIGVAQIISDFAFYLPFDPNIVQELQDKKVGSFSTLCVTEELQGRGIGQALSKHRYEWIRKQGCDVLLGISWVSGHKHTSDRVFEKMGFKAQKQIEKFFYDYSMEKNFVCPSCGGPPCVCSAIFYRMDLRD